MDRPPTDHGSDRYDYIEVDAPAGVALPPWLNADWRPCLDCRANAFLTWQADTGRWKVRIAHDTGCPVLAAAEREQR